MNLPPKILVIDDDQRGGRTIRNYLTTQGYDVCYANNGALGIEKAFEYIPDLVLCAFKMDHLDGAQVLNVLKRNPLFNMFELFLVGMYSSYLCHIYFAKGSFSISIACG